MLRDEGGMKPEPDPAVLQGMVRRLEFSFKQGEAQVNSFAGDAAIIKYYARCG